MPNIVLDGDTGSHGGIVIASGPHTSDGRRVALVGDTYMCAIPTHGVQTIVSGSGVAFHNGVPLAITGSVTSCGAILTGTASTTTTG